MVICPNFRSPSHGSPSQGTKYIERAGGGFGDEGRTSVDGGGLDVANRFVRGVNRGGRGLQHQYRDRQMKKQLPQRQLQNKLTAPRTIRTDSKQKTVGDAPKRPNNTTTCDFGFVCGPVARATVNVKRRRLFWVETQSHRADRKPSLQSMVICS